MSNNEYETIMATIRAGLTGEADKDIPYLREQAEAYKGHPLQKEIIRECYRMIYGKLPEELKKQFTDALDKDTEALSDRLEQAERERSQGNLKGALEIVEKLAQDIEAAGMYADDEVSEYRDFEELFEDLLYRHQYQPKREIRRPGFQCARLYMLLGSLRIDDRRIGDARAALEKGLHWCPVNFALRCEYAETFRMLGDMDGFWRESLEMFRCAFRPKQVGRCFRNFSFYFVEKKLYPVAVGCLKRSLEFDPTAKNAVRNEYNYICSQVGGQVPLPSAEKFCSFAERYGFPTDPDETVFGLARACAKASMDKGNSKTAVYMLLIVFGLTTDKESRKDLKTLIAQLEGTGE